MRPRSIERFEKIYFGTLAISLVSVALSWSQTVAESDERLPGSGAALAAGVLMVAFAVSLLLWWLVARRASNFAKWVLVVLTAIGLLGFLSSLVSAAVPKDLNFAVSAITNLLSVYAVWLLFRPDAAAWLDSKGADGPGDPKTFD